jgi:hypothetical protein
MLSAFRRIHSRPGELAAGRAVDFAVSRLQQVGGGVSARKTVAGESASVRDRHLKGHPVEQKFSRDDAKILIDKRFALHLLLAPFARELINAGREHAKKEKFCMRER